MKFKSMFILSMVFMAMLLPHQVIAEGMVDEVEFESSPAPTPTVAPTPSPFQEEKDHWRFMIAPYGWLFGINGTMTVKGNSVKLDTTPADTFDILSDVDALGEVHMEASKNRWTFMLDPTYLKITQDAAANASVTTELGLVDFGAFYTLAESLIENNESHAVKLQFLGAGRYFNTKMTIRPQGLPSVSRRQNFITPIIGLRYVFKFGEHVNGILRGDYGGFNIDDVKRTWSVNAMVDYQFNPTIAVGIGYRLLGINFSKGNADTKFKQNTRYFGPMLGLIFRF